MEDKEKGVIGELIGISAPIGTILGPTWDGRFLVVLGHQFNKAQIGYATVAHMRAANDRCHETHVYNSQTELGVFKAWGIAKRDPEQIMAETRAERMKQIGKLHGTPYV